MEGQDMTDYSELVKDLRDTERVCRDRMDGQVMLDAAAAIEALQAELERKRTADCFGCKCEKVEPKRGEWIWDDKRCIYVCSVCGSPKVRENMDRQIIKEQAYCYSCGAKMMEVQE